VYDGYAKGKHTPAESKPLVKDADKEGVHGGFSYSSLVGMLLHLSGHTQPNIAYAVNCCATYVLCPKHSHDFCFEMHWEIPQTDIRAQNDYESFH
jgi:hypothetical protein